MTREELNIIRERWEKYSNEIMGIKDIETQLAYAQWLAMVIPTLLNTLNLLESERDYWKANAQALANKISRK